MINVLCIVGKEERRKLLKQDFEEIFVLEKVSTWVYVSKLWGPILEQSGIFESGKFDIYTSYLLVAMLQAGSGAVVWMAGSS